MPRQHPFCKQDTDLNLALPLLLKKIQQPKLKINSIMKDENGNIEYGFDYGTETRYCKLSSYLYCGD